MIMETKFRSLIDFCHILLWAIILTALTSLSDTAEQSSNDTNQLARPHSIEGFVEEFNDFDETLSRKPRGLYEDYYYPIHPPHPKYKKGHYVPVSEYYVKHHKPGYDEWSKKKPEVWEYKGTYHYKKKKKKHYPPPPPPFLPAAMVAAGLPLIMMPLITMLMTMPVLVPVNGGTTIDDGTGFINNVNGGGSTSFITTAGLSSGLNSNFITNGRRRRAVSNGQPDIARALKIREMQLVGDYLRQVSYDASQQHRLLANYLQCQGMLASDEHCLERLACEFRKKKPDQRRKIEELEKTVTSIFLGHILHNEFIPRSFKRRLKNAVQFGRQSENSCSNRYRCATIDGASSVNSTRDSNRSEKAANPNYHSNQWTDADDDEERKNLLAGAK